MRQVHNSIDFRLASVSGNTYAFSYNIERTLLASTDISIQNYANGVARSAWYNKYTKRLYVQGVDGYWTVNGAVLTLHGEPVYNNVTDLFANSAVPEQHRMVFGGRNLGSFVTAAQKTAIHDGSFLGMLVGDYWNINNIVWRIADIDYWLNTGDTPFTAHHLVIMPDSPIVNSVRMNDTDTTSGGYVGTDMYTTTLPALKTIVCDAAFPNMILAHDEYLVNGVTNGVQTSAIWASSSVELPSEIMMYGSRVISSNDNRVGSRTLDRQELALFTLMPCYVRSTSYTVWLRDVASDTTFAVVGGNGLANSMSVSNYGNVRPVFAIG